MRFREDQTVSVSGGSPERVRTFAGLIGAASIAVLFTASGHHLVAAQPPPQPVPASESVSSQRALLDEYCVTCHSDRQKDLGLVPVSLQTVDLGNVAASAELFENVVRKLRGNQMPPVGRRRPDQATLNGFAAWVEAEVDRASAANPNPGRTEAFHRLNRAEYQNAIRDLLALEVDVAQLLPSDDASYGFDNIAGVQRISPTLLDRYMAVARQISRQAVGVDLPATAETFRIRADFSQENRVQGLPAGTRGGTLIHYTFPLDAEYEIKVGLAETTAGGFTIRGARATEPHDLEISVDGERAGLFTIAPSQGTGEYGEVTTRDDIQARVPVKAGPREVAVTFIAKTAALAEGIRQPFSRIHAEADTSYQPDVGSVTISGPFDTVGSGDTASRRRIFVCHPTTSADEAPCARQILATLARRAYRRPVADAEIDSLLNFYREGRARDGFEAGIEMAVRAVLVSPEFLFRIERDPSNVAADTTYHISDLELASRVSFFLWSSIPDDELLELAIGEQLRNPGVLEQQVQRMLADTRSQALTRNFAGQWLYLRNLPAVLPNEWLYPDFSDNLRQDFRRETELFFGSILRENRSVLDLLTADYTFLNERLAKHYGVPNVYGTSFRRVELADVNRRGLLGQASILTTTSYPDRTSVVKRGAWILENLIGAPPPPPPANVPPLEDNKGAASPRSLRERMEAHRENPVCASCHAPMDPLGFALENFDPTGRWRSGEDFTPWSNELSPIDAAAVLPDGTTFEGPTGLRDYLLTRSEEIVTSVTEKLLTYALGRGVEYYDRPAVRSIVKGAAPSDYTLSSIILGIVESTPFQMRSST